MVPRQAIQPNTMSISLLTHLREMMSCLDAHNVFPLVEILFKFALELFFCVNVPSDVVLEVVYLVGVL